MSMSREAKRYHEEYEAAPETIRWAVDSAYDEVVGICKAAGLPVSNCDAGETLVADIFKFIIKSKIEKDGWAEVPAPKPTLVHTPCLHGETDGCKACELLAAEKWATQ